MPFVTNEGEGATSNGVYGLKMFTEHFDVTRQTRWCSRLPNLRYVRLERRDILGQAISLSIARQTGSYASWITERMEPVYDRKHVQSCLDFIVTGKARWRLFFAQNAISPLELVYQVVVTNPQRAIDAIGQLVSVSDAVINYEAVDTSPQRGARNELWRDRFIAATADLDVIPPLTPTLRA